MAEPTEIIALADLKLALRVTNYDEDTEIARKLASATAECRSFINAPIPCLADNTAPPDLVNGIVLLVQADYELDPMKRDTIRTTAERLWYPYRVKVGI